MAFYPDPQLSVQTPEGGNIVAWVYRQLNRLSGDQFLVDYLVVSETNIEPAKPANGMIAFADGVNWNPGSGRGMYWYDADASSWIKL